ncbi:MAG: hypothetical protein ACRELX_16620, partial [Longimicrobiales bacterium]
EVMQAVATQEHFIAVVELVWLRSIDERFTRDVKILAIDGVRPDDPRYPLRLTLRHVDDDAIGGPAGTARSARAEPPAAVVPR